MAKGKIVYGVSAFKALVMDETFYLYLDNSDFNFGTEDFAVDALLEINSATADSESWIAGKGPLDLDGLSGWHWYYTKADRKLHLRINDGQLAATVVSSSAGAFDFGERFWARVAVDRDDKAYLYVNGVLVGSGDVGGCKCSVSNSSLLKIGGYDASSYRMKGYLDSIRFDQGILLSSDWMTAEWNNLRFGLARTISDFKARWTFYNTLVDLSSNGYTLTYSGSGSATYVAGWPEGVVYQFPINFKRGHSPGYVDVDDIQRAISGDLYLFPGPRKRQFQLEFTCHLLQKDLFMTLWSTGTEFDFYEDGDQAKTCTGVMSAPPDARSLGSNYYDVALEIIEV